MRNMFPVDTRPPAFACGRVITPTLRSKLDTFNDNAGCGPDLGILPAPGPACDALTCPVIGLAFAFFEQGVPGQAVIGPGAIFAPLCAGAPLVVTFAPAVPALPAGITLAPCGGNPETVCVTYNGIGPDGFWAGTITVSNGIAPPCSFAYQIQISGTILLSSLFASFPEQAAHAASNRRIRR